MTHLPVLGFTEQTFLSPQIFAARQRLSMVTALTSDSQLSLKQNTAQEDDLVVSAHGTDVQSDLQAEQPIESRDRKNE